MKIYIDTEFKCHISPGDTRRETESDFFDGKCRAFIEGYRYIPDGESWVREDGAKFVGEMIAPVVDSRMLEMAQAAYEEALAQSAEQMTDMQAALELLGVAG